MVSNILYRLVAFADFSNLGNTKENISALEKEFADEKYTISPLVEANGLGNIYRGNTLIGSDNNPIINISSQRIEVIRGSDKKTGFDETEQLIVKEQLTKYLSRVYDCFSSCIQDSNRLAWVTEYAFFEIDEETMSSFRNRFLIPLNYYTEKSTNEFVAKYAGVDEKIICGRQENLNVISTIRRWFPGQGMGYVASVDGYGVEIDINTVARNKKNRFSLESFGEFVSVADEIKSDLVGELFHGCY